MSRKKLTKRELEIGQQKFAPTGEEFLKTHTIRQETKAERKRRLANETPAERKKRLAGEASLKRFQDKLKKGLL